MLSLWQKNDVFTMDIIQPLLDMAIAPVFPVVENGITAAGKEAQELNVDLCHYAVLFRF